MYMCIHTYIRAAALGTPPSGGFRHCGHFVVIVVIIVGIIIIVVSKGRPCPWLRPHVVHP